jgi:hypothetical protein
VPRVKLYHATREQYIAGILDSGIFTSEMCDERGHSQWGRWEDGQDDCVYLGTKPNAIGQWGARIVTVRMPIHQWLRNTHLDQRTTGRAPDYLRRPWQDLAQDVVMSQDIGPDWRLDEIIRLPEYQRIEWMNHHEVDGAQIVHHGNIPPEWVEWEPVDVRPNYSHRDPDAYWSDDEDV